MASVILYTVIAVAVTLWVVLVYHQGGARSSSVKMTFRVPLLPRSDVSSGVDKDRGGFSVPIQVWFPWVTSNHCSTRSNGTGKLKVERDLNIFLKALYFTHEPFISLHFTHPFM